MTTEEHLRVSLFFAVLAMIFWSAVWMLNDITWAFPALGCNIVQFYAIYNMMTNE